MAISTVIDVADPDGAIKKVSYLDNAIRSTKIDTQERMETSIIDTGVTGWLTTTSKELKEGLARIATGLVAARTNFTTDFSPQTLKDGKLYLSTDGTNTQSFDYYNGAAWTVVPIGASNLLTDSVTTAKILDANVTTAKIAANAVSALRLNETNVTDDTRTGSVALVLIGTTSGNDFTVTFTPNSANSIIVCVLQCAPSIENTGGTAGDYMTFSILETVGATTLASTRSNRRDQVPEGTASQRSPITLVGVQTGMSAIPRTWEAHWAISNAGATAHLEGDVVTARFMVFEFMK